MRTPGSPELLEERRRIAARMMRAGDEADDIAQRLDVHVQSVRGWRREYEAGGMDALLAKPHPGPECRLTDDQKRQLLTLLERPPTDHGFEDRHLWTTRLIAELIRRRFGVSYHHDHVGVMLHGLGYSCQKPQTRPRERDEQAIEHWREVEWPAIAKRSRERGATVVFADEAGFMMRPSVKKQWAPRGQTPVVAHRGRHHEKVSVIGGLAVEPRPGGAIDAHLAFHPGRSVKGPEAAAFVRQLVKAIDGPVTLIWDRLNVHRSRPVKQTLLDHPQVEVHLLPPYAPDLNAIEGLWCHSKHHELAQYCPHELDELTEAAESAIERSSTPNLLHACLRQTGLHDALYPSSAQ